MSDTSTVTALWQDAMNILETASADREAGPSEIAILLDERNGMRIVDAGGWNLDALKREYSATTAYTMKRSGGSVIVEASSGSDQCTFKKTLPGNPLAAAMATSMPRHLIHPQPALLT